MIGEEIESKQSSGHGPSQICRAFTDIIDTEKETRQKPNGIRLCIFAFNL